MTRVNIGIPPEELTQKHLLAEHREIKRIPNAISNGKYDLKGIPENFKLGKGHVKFFYNKLLYLKNRYEEIYKECKKRNYNVAYFGDSWNDIPKHLMNDYSPTVADINIIKERINERLKNAL